VVRVVGDLGRPATAGDQLTCRGNRQATSATDLSSRTTSRPSRLPSSANRALPLEASAALRPAAAPAGQTLRCRPTSRQSAVGGGHDVPWAREHDVVPSAPWRGCLPAATGGPPCARGVVEQVVTRSTTGSRCPPPPVAAVGPHGLNFPWIETHRAPVATATAAHRSTNVSCRPPPPSLVIKQSCHPRRDQAIRVRARTGPTGEPRPAPRVTTLSVADLLADDVETRRPGGSRTRPRPASANCVVLARPTLVPGGSACGADDDLARVDDLTAKRLTPTAARWIAPLRWTRRPSCAISRAPTSSRCR